MTPKKELKARILEVATRYRDIVMNDDGYYVFWPDGYARGYYTAEDMRFLAEILDEKNKDWDEQVHRELSNEGGTV